mmetsp:Transcript_69629/g.192556  ORF Transcript_69629/g.192556 Transcript_69629/m.192556 type:complete len:339 (-) Transcript_69629:85-1101(-)
MVSTSAAAVSVALAVAAPVSVPVPLSIAVAAAMPRVPAALNTAAARQLVAMWHGLIVATVWTFAHEATFAAKVALAAKLAFGAVITHATKVALATKVTLATKLTFVAELALSSQIAFVPKVTLAAKVPLATRVALAAKIACGKVFAFATKVALPAKVAFGTTVTLASEVTVEAKVALASKIARIPVMQAAPSNGIASAHPGKALVGLASLAPGTTAALAAACRLPCTDKVALAVKAAPFASAVHVTPYSKLSLSARTALAGVLPVAPRARLLHLFHWPLMVVMLAAECLRWRRPPRLLPLGCQTAPPKVTLRPGRPSRAQALLCRGRRRWRLPPLGLL